MRRRLEKNLNLDPMSTRKKAPVRRRRFACDRKLWGGTTVGSWEEPRPDPSKETPKRTHFLCLCRSDHARAGNVGQRTHTAEIAWKQTKTFSTFFFPIDGICEAVKTNLSFPFFSKRLVYIL
uniref:Uncharacterized protein n=1 Tax=Palpitomonas bilix TaxID=652834 RepID=A0A7S3D9W4_9EUKA